MKNWGGHFTPELGGQFELESGGHFKLELGGQYHRNMHNRSETIKLTVLPRPLKNHIEFDIVNFFKSSKKRFENCPDRVTKKILKHTVSQ